MSNRQVWGEFTLDSEPTENSNNPVESGGVYAAIKEGLTSRPDTRYGYSLLGTVSVIDVNKRGIMGLDVYCCERVESPVKIEALISYKGTVIGSYKCTATFVQDTTRFKLSYRMASDSSADLPKFEVWLIDTQSSSQSTRRIGCDTHMVYGLTWTDGDNTTETLPAGLTDFTLSFNSSN